MNILLPRSSVTDGTSAPSGAQIHVDITSSGFHYNKAQNGRWVQIANGKRICFKGVGGRSLWVVSFILE